MRVLYLPIGKQEGTERAFRRFADTKVFDFIASAKPNEELTKMALDFKPDLVHMQLQMTNKVKPATLSDLKSKLPNTIFTNWTGDIRRKPCKNFIGVSKVVDYSLMSNVGQIDLYTQQGCVNARYWQIGYDPQVYFPKNNRSFKYDVAFIGSNYGNIFPDGKMRTKVAENLKKKYGSRAGIFGNSYAKALKIKACDITEANNIYNDSICVVSISNFNNVSHYFSDRMLMCLASGRPTIAFKFPGSDSYFADRGDFLVASSEADVFNLVEECRANIDWANHIGRNGHLKVFTEHTFESRILELFSITGLSSML